jgi:hypothetical protein
MSGIDNLQNLSDSIEFPAVRLRAVTPNDTTPLVFVCKALYVGTGGNVAIMASEDTAAVTLTNVQSGSIIPVRARRVMATGTTATGIVALS